MKGWPALSISFSLFQLLLFQEKKRKILKIDQTLCTVALSSLHACKYKIVKTFRFLSPFSWISSLFLGLFKIFLILLNYYHFLKRDRGKTLNYLDTVLNCMRFSSTRMVIVRGMPIANKGIKRPCIWKGHWRV
jgi:hypothetical protein